MDNDMHKQGFFYRDLVEVARVLDLIYKNLSENKVSYTSIFIAKDQFENILVPIWIYTRF